MGMRNPDGSWTTSSGMVIGGNNNGLAGSNIMGGIGQVGQGLTGLAGLIGALDARDQYKDTKQSNEAQWDLTRQQLDQEITNWNNLASQMGGTQRESLALPDNLYS